MTMTVEITGNGKNRKAKVGPTQSLHVSHIVPDVPRIGSNNRLRYNSFDISDDGTNSGNQNMAVDGSAVNQHFYLQSNRDYDIIVRRLVILLADGSVALNKFGAINKLANGWDLSVIENGVETPIIDSATTTGEIITATGVPTSYEILSAYNQANDDALLLDLDLTTAIEGGIRIGMGTLDRIQATVKDNLTDLSNFKVTVIGYRHYPIDAEEMY